ncbi:HIRAN domain-containing protein [Sulfuritortus calidifontis]|uniref:HIRAN domain-containing protein n=1 Tax=Sulfuritortus calidifontis TaxID=1914471 RepID=A0A4R3JT84_9PROT|nr:HIRAN domain-containing protein [Sulfuritortus calidifontis]TCS70560.1 HIRAN domain-containing protein [Sulfuritortus calidifontis]
MPSRSDWRRHLLAWLLMLPATLAAGQIELLVQTSPVAGFQYHAGPALWPLMRAGDALSLVREPGNPYDPRAIRVEWNGAPIGFVPRLDNLDLARLMDGGVKPAARIVHLQASRDPWRRVLIEVYLDPEPATIPASSQDQRPVQQRPPTP